MFANFRSAPGRLFGDTVHLHRAADGEFDIFPGVFQRNDDVVGFQLRIVDDLLGAAHDTERDVDATQDFIPMRHRLRAEHFIENGGELRHVLH